MTTIASNLQAVRGAMAESIKASARKTEAVRLIAVSKTFSAEDILQAYQAGQRSFGESYVQEAVQKIAKLPQPDIEWHFIGPIQSNKTRPIAEHFAWVHGIERAKIAERLSAQRPAHLPPLQVCIEVNVSGEASKSGITPDELDVLAKYVANLPRLCLRGLMAVPAPTEDIAQQRAAFARLRELRDHLNRNGMALDTLSMGMSHDFAAAIAEGATLVRIGTAIFGQRNYH